MSGRVDLKDLNALGDLRTALGRFSDSVEEITRAIDTRIQQEREWLDDCVRQAQTSLESEQKSLSRAEAALRACEGSGERASRNCSAQARAVTRAHERVVRAQDRLRTAKRWQKAIEREVAKYRLAARDVHVLADSHTDRARAKLGDLVRKYEAVQAAARTISTGGTVSTVSPACYPGQVTWSEQKAILARIDKGESISLEEFGKLQQLASDVRYETLALEDQAWIASVARGEEFYRLTRSLWSGEGPSSEVLSQPVLGGLVSILKELLGTSLDIRDIVQFWQRPD